MHNGSIATLLPIELQQPPVFTSNESECERLVRVAAVQLRKEAASSRCRDGKHETSLVGCQGGSLPQRAATATAQRASRSGAEFQRASMIAFD